VSDFATEDLTTSELRRFLTKTFLLADGTESVNPDSIKVNSVYGSFLFIAILIGLLF
jgi:hypothetical protein